MKAGDLKRQRHKQKKIRKISFLISLGGPQIPEII